MADWRDVSFDGQTIRGVSSANGPFEVALNEVIAVGEHIARDHPDPLVANLYLWTSFMTQQEHGSVWEGVPGYYEFLTDVHSAVAERSDVERMPLYWADWDNGLGRGTRFIYPPWVFGFPLYEWTLESGPSSTWDRLTGAAIDDWVEPVFGATARWLLSQPPDDSEQKKRWKRFISAPPRPPALGRRRMGYHWEPPTWLRRLRALAVLPTLFAVVFLLDRSESAVVAWFGVVAIAVTTALAWLPQLFAATTLYDEGLTARTWLFHRNQCFYDDIAAIEEDEACLRITLRDGSLLATTKRGDQPGGFRNAIEHRRLFSLSKRYAERYGIPYRSPDLKY